MQYNRVEICGVNTSKLKVLKEKEKTELLCRMHSGDKSARDELINGNLRLVLSVVGAENLPPPLRIVAEARLNNFEMSLSELAEEIGIGRSAANYRLRKLCEMAEDIRTKMPD